jgi:hypothetical protein
MGALVLSPSARADILFIDMNENTQEVAAAQAAAKERGETLVVIPNIPTDVRARLDQLKTQEQPYLDKEGVLVQQGEELYKQQVKIKNPSASETAAYQAKLDTLSKESTAILAQATPFDNQIQAILNTDTYHVTAAKIDQLLTQYDQQGKQFDSIVLSSHHVAYFYSDYGSNLEEGDLTALIAAHPKQQAGIASVYFWGCYNGSAPTMMAWKGTFPNAKVMVGWDGLAPEEHRAIDEDLLKDLLIKEQGVSQMADAQKMLAEYKSIPGVQESSGAFANFCAQLWVGPGGVQNLGKMKCNQDYLDKVTATASTAFSAYYNATNQPGGSVTIDTRTDYSDVPVNRDDSALRTAYSQLREVEDCPGMGPMKAEVPDILNLIYFKTIEKNFQVYFGADITKANKLLAPYGASIPDFSNPAVTRAQVLSEAQTLYKFITNPPAALPPQTLSLLASLDLQMNQDLVTMKGVDTSWLTPANDKSYLHAPIQPTISAAPVPVPTPQQ